MANSTSQIAAAMIVGITRRAVDDTATRLANVRFDHPARALLSDLLLLMGSVFYASENLVESGLRDAHAICASCASLEKWRGLQEGAGRVRLGLDPQFPSF